MSNKVDIINMSFGCEFYLTGVAETLEDASYAGIILLAAASNSGPNELNTTGTTITLKSGSSYATPIAAGIIANCIEWIDYMRANDRLTADQYAFLRRSAGIRTILKKQSVKVSDNILSIVPWKLWKEDPTGPIVEFDEKADRHVLELLLSGVGM
ncbi:hypothetical protein GGR58DRAFT_485044 [Xylaria digitata]|nr:hypothetical protein GGR58DRAFT_485044 [Xylaria digitata]